MLPNFDEPYWNLLQTLGWIYLGDRALVVECYDKSEHERTFWEKRRLPDGEVRWVEISSGPPSMMSLYVWGEGQSRFWKMTFLDRIFLICAVVIQQDR